ncbi:MAG: polyphosphate polymerase domain-containing protein [Calditrichaeota bacterium]|jgi:hypothetical protein|nr:polyphosphate polymerase domain-containing protein [Calditrichota bacterium]MBT7616945.1 polyphosphate polymerase domain-containing protein [Calditrichota bacterium]MBT7789498.1 polyphosphate polymerase domain-containing protein [Calditrichota bacterium]
MKGESQKGLPPLIERFEMKFTIPFSMIKPISEFASVYCSLDKYSQRSENTYYKVNNLYFDTPEYLLLRMRMMGVQNRFNLRVRSYGDDVGMPYFLEIKQKTGQIVRKYRAKVIDPNWFNVYTEPGFESTGESEDPLEVRNRTLFERLVYSYNASPKVLTQYIRKAWVSDVDDYGRVTFDRELMYKPEREYNLVPDDDLMLACDPETVFDPDCSVVLELKCYSAFVPLWMIDLIRYFDLQRRSFSKYMTGVREVLGLDVYSSPSTASNVRF